ncbi:phosphotransferase [Umboniibacter marinipuniceus]|uniref:Choline/ethanolamine kinase n=1 Tax=Umboniibacter marinipuniceus TaxID=569599 RepID=A0A3M0ACY4_9GAMM|nr:phosphotransferase [Umboniibacter marinipuniceus]RMA82396.1 choline/ethanolamine kinase [Umboniibacter marinipuniceus]
MTDTFLQQGLSELHPTLAQCRVEFSLSGTANQVFKARVGEQLLAVRMMSVVRDAATPRKAEHEVWLTLQHRDLAPELFHWDSNHQFCIAKWIDSAGVPLANELIQLLVKLHTSPIPASCPKIDLLMGSKLYLDELALPIKPFIDHFQRLLNALALSQLSHSLCHNDLVAGNIIKDGSQLWLIDFEYSGINHPYFDLCSSWNSFINADESLNAFAQRYLVAIGEEFNDTEQAALAAAHELSLWVGLLWALAKQPSWQEDYRKPLSEIDNSVTQQLLHSLMQLAIL